MALYIKFIKHLRQLDVLRSWEVMCWLPIGKMPALKEPRGQVFRFVEQKILTVGRKVRIGHQVLFAPVSTLSSMWTEQM